MEEEVEIEKSFFLTKEGDLTTKIRFGTLSVEVGQEVVSNGRFCVPNGTVGYVSQIHEPYTRHFSSNVIEVMWEGDPCGMCMKFKDLRF